MLKWILSLIQLQFLLNDWLALNLKSNPFTFLEISNPAFKSLDPSTLIAYSVSRLDLGVKFYLPSNASKITPTVYLGLSNADIQLKTFNRSGSDILMMSHQRNWGGTVGMGLNYDLNNDTAISLDYSWTAYEKNEEQVSTFPEFAKSRPEINSLSLKLKKYF